MTSNQIAYKQAQETARSNRAKEKLEKESIEQKERASKRDVYGKGFFQTLNKALNDKAWYNEDPSMVRDTANISYNTPLGNRVRGLVKSSVRVVPGIYAITWVPTIGNSGYDYKNNVANIASKQLYSYVRYANSGARNYEPQDLLMYFMAIDQASSYYAALTRIYSAVMTSKSQNKYWIDSMLYSLGVNPKDIRSNIANLRAYINSFAVRANAFYVPNNMSLFKRHAWMNSTFFKDSPVKKSQDYVFVQARFGVYNFKRAGIDFSHTTVQGDSYVEICPEFKPGANITFEQLRTLGDHLLNSLTNVEDIGIMSGDVLKAYGEGNMIYFPSIDENYHIESVFSEEVLSQITNAHLVRNLLYPSDYNLAAGEQPGNKLAKTPFDILQTTDGFIYQGGSFMGYQDSDLDYETSGIESFVGLATDYGFSGQFRPTSSSGRSAFEDLLDFNNLTINMYKDEVTPDENMVATRLMVGTIGVIAAEDRDGTLKNALLIQSNGTEVCLTGYMVKLDPTTGVASHDETGYLNFIDGTKTYNATQWPLRDIWTQYSFDWSPVTNEIVLNNISDPTVADDVMTSRDNANYADINRQVLNNMHYTAILSEFAIPQLGVKVRSR